MTIRLHMEVDGEVKGIASYFPEHEIVKLWEGLSPEYMGPAQPARSALHEPIGGNVLDVVEHLSDGVIRRTWWRLPSEEHAKE